MEGRRRECCADACLLRLNDDDLDYLTFGRTAQTRLDSDILRHVENCTGSAEKSIKSFNEIAQDEINVLARATAMKSWIVASTISVQGEQLSEATRAL